MSSFILFLQSVLLKCILCPYVLGAVEYPQQRVGGWHCSYRGESAQKKHYSLWPHHSALHPGIWDAKVWQKQLMRRSTHHLESVESAMKLDLINMQQCENYRLYYSHQYYFSLFVYRLCKPQISDVIVDPMCGSGAIPLEVSSTLICFCEWVWFMCSIVLQFIRHHHLNQFDLFRESSSGQIHSSFLETTMTWPSVEQLITSTTL